MQQKLTPGSAFLLTLPPLLWAGNAVVGRVVRDMVSPMTLNFIRWLLAFLVLLPLAARLLRRGSALWPHWKLYAALGLFGVGCYNAFQYLALQTSTPVNTSLVGSSVPLWSLIIGALCFGARITRWQLAGTALSIAGVLLVLSRGRWEQLAALHLVPGDLYMLLAAMSWALYSWLLSLATEPAEARRDWASFLMAQLAFGLPWSALFAAGEWSLARAHFDWSWQLAAALAFIAAGPALTAYRCWGLGVQRAGPQIAGFFNNLTPLFTALLSAAFLGELPQWFHGAAFVLIVGGIWMSSRPSGQVKA
jgi:drug/metabolite transporter (DMT)-like permease